MAVKVKTPQEAPALAPDALAELAQADQPAEGQTAQAGSAEAPAAGIPATEPEPVEKIDLPPSVEEGGIVQYGTFKLGANVMTMAPPEQTLSFGQWVKEVQKLGHQWLSYDHSFWRPYYDAGQTPNEATQHVTALIQSGS
jgi:hypothetical protein